MAPLVTNTTHTAIMTTMSNTQQVAKTNAGLGATALILGAIAFMLAGFATTWWAVIIAVPALLVAAFTLNKNSVKATPLIGITLATIAIIATLAMQAGAA